MLVINKEEQKRLVDMEEVLDYVEKALVAFSNKETETPNRTALPFGGKENTALFMPSIAENIGSLGVKVVNVVPGNRFKNKKTINGLVLLFDIETGEPKAVLDGSYITQVRTGALTGVATKYLARENSRILGIIGTGEQAYGLCHAIFTVRKIGKVFLYSRTQNKAKAFASYLEEKYGVTTEVVSDENRIVEQSDIIVTATNANLPVYSKMLKKGTHLNAVGSFRPDMQEIPSSSILEADRVVVESKEAALEETGDLQQPIAEGFDSSRLSELGDIISGLKESRGNKDEITVFKSVGLAVVDVLVAEYIFEKATLRRKGKWLSLLE